ncbi:MAG TPA: MucB/RseB C-terminal domain-containing protein, partial [Steroidobacteraceae bacterium]|nr:MucB/RseB C-terminal domain-containing protein [Steroidobacteraceae bacterium]
MSLMTLPFARTRVARGARAFIFTLAMAMAMAMATASVSVHAADDTSQDARQWLEKMSRALAARNYDGRFLHVVGGHTENMRIIHRVDSQSVTERLISLDGSGRELVRTDTEVVCYLPDRRTVLIERRSDSNSLLATVPLYSEGLQAHYIIATPGVTRLLGRPVQYLTVQPRDNFRYGYKLWLDVETGMPLKSQLCDSRGRVLEQIVFSELTAPSSIDAALMKSSIDTAGFRWIRQEARALRLAPNTASSGSAAGTGWIIVNPPQGFKLTVTRTQTILGAPAPVRHLVLSDGLASVSVFIEPIGPPSGNPVLGGKGAASVATAVKNGELLRDAIPEFARVGAALAYSTEKEAHRITAVGEVPTSTLRAITAAIQRDMASEGA